MQREPVKMIIKGFLFGCLSVFCSFFISVPSMALGLFPEEIGSFTDAFRQAFFGDAELYDGFLMGQDTKADLEPQIASARAMLEQTGVDAVMFARGAMGNPFIFRDTTSLLTTGSYEPVPAAVRIQTGFAELERLAAETSEEHACLEMRKRFHAYSKGIPNGGPIRNAIVHASSIAEYREIFKDVNCNAET